MYCNRCGAKVNQEDDYCFYCGSKLNHLKVVKTEEKSAKKRTPFGVFAIVSFIIGLVTLASVVSMAFDVLVSVRIGFEIFEGSEFILSLHGIVAGILGIKSKRKRMAVAGLVTSSIATVVSILLFIILL